MMITSGMQACILVLITSAIVNDTRSALIQLFQADTRRRVRLKKELSVLSNPDSLEILHLKSTYPLLRFFISCLIIIFHVLTISAPF